MIFSTASHVNCCTFNLICPISTSNIFKTELLSSYQACYIIHRRFHCDAMMNTLPEISTRSRAICKVGLPRCRPRHRWYNFTHQHFHRLIWQWMIFIHSAKSKKFLCGSRLHKAFLAWNLAAAAEASFLTSAVYLFPTWLRLCAKRLTFFPKKKSFFSKGYFLLIAFLF